MKYVPFYYHYFKKDPAVVDALNDAFRPRGLQILEFPCLCRLETSPIVNSPIALIHGSRGSDKECYNRIEEKLLLNPNTTFYIWDVNFTLEDPAQVFQERTIVRNCKLINFKNLMERIHEIESWARKK